MEWNGKPARYQWSLANCHLLRLFCRLWLTLPLNDYQVFNLYCLQRLLLCFTASRPMPMVINTALCFSPFPQAQDPGTAACTWCLKT